MAKPKKKKSKTKDKSQIEIIRNDLITHILKEVGPEAQLLGAGGLAKQKIRGVISTQVPGIDAIIGRGGIPLGRLTMISGSEGCIAGGSFLSYDVWKGGKRINRKGGTIRRLYERFTGKHTKEESNRGRKLWMQGCEFYVKSVDHEGKVVRNRVLDVVKTGKNKCFKLELSTGEVLFSTADHKYMTPNGFVKLSDLNIGDTLFVHNNTRIKGRRKEYLYRPEVMVRYHPYLPEKKVKDNKTGKTYIYYRGRRSRFVYEAYLNNMSTKDFIRSLNTKTVAEIDLYKFIPQGMHIHHKDENFHNDEIRNLELISPEEHGALHVKDNLRNLSFVVVSSEIINITPVGVLETYDIKCAYPYNNYIAEGIVVHNCGKTTLALHIVAECQRQGGVVVYIDKEYKLDVDYAGHLGVDIDKVILSQPPYLEKVFDMVEQIIERVANTRQKTKQRVPILIVLDSMNAAIAKEQYDGKWEDKHYAPQARVFSQSLPRLMPVISKEDVALLFISQTRKNIGVQYGDDQKTSGGSAPRFYSSLILKVSYIGADKEGDSRVANKTRIECIKNQISPPFKKTEGKIRFGKGFDKMNSLLWHCIKLKLIKKSGAWYSYKGERLGQGIDKAADKLRKDKETRKKIMKLLRKEVGW